MVCIWGNYLKMKMQHGYYAPAWLNIGGGLISSGDVFRLHRFLLDHHRLPHEIHSGRQKCHRYRLSPHLRLHRPLLSLGGCGRSMTVLCLWDSRLRLGHRLAHLSLDRRPPRPCLVGGLCVWFWRLGAPDYHVVISMLAQLIKILHQALHTECMNIKNFIH
jgi:hypothetical protein